MDNTDRVDRRCATCVRPAKELRRIDRILNQWTDSEIAGMYGADARGVARLREIRQALGRTLAVTPVQPR